MRFTYVAAIVVAACGARSDLTEAGSYTISLDRAAITLTQGGPPVAVSVHVTRQDGFHGAVSLNVTDLPNGVSANDFVVPADGAEAVIELAASLNANQGDHGSVEVRATAVGVASQNAPLKIFVRGCAGCLDTTFGVLGAATVAGGTVAAIAIDGSDNIHVALYESGALALARFTSDGNFDAAYGNGGLVSLPLALHIAPRAILLTPGNSVVVGSAYSATTALLERVTDVGTLDSAFGVGGIAQLPSGAAGDLLSLQSRPAGALLAVGRQQGAVPAAWLLETSPTGALDGSFGSGGEVVANWSGDGGWAVGASSNSDGTLTVAGTSLTSSGSEFALVRYAPDGALDSTFVAASVAGVARDMLATQASTFTIAGDVDSEARLARYQGNGSLDTTFGDSGVVTLNEVGGLANSVAIVVAEQSDGELLLVGGDMSSVNAKSYLVRLRSDGTVDDAFAAAGIVLLGAATPQVSVQCLALQSDGRIILGGFQWNGTDGDALLLRYWP